jgi:uncharacterized protein YggT (Ycf19 family)
MAYISPEREPITTEREVTPDSALDDRAYQERPVTPRDDYRMNVAERIVWLVAGIVMGLLALRFLLRLLGANPNNGFADFIYNLSYPFAAPFFGLFNYTAQLNTGRFEFETLIAILVYALVAWLIARVVTLGKR